MHRVSIWDMDFYHKKSFIPNPIATKLSSFHKQKGHLVNFVTEEYHIGLSYDEFYIIKEKGSTPKPPRKLIDDVRVHLIGKPMRFFSGYWEVPHIISAVRPDYMLYPEQERNSYYNANIAQFYHKGKLLLKKQGFENTLKHHKKTLVIDKEFWDTSIDNIKTCLLELKAYRNIAFLYPISLKILIQNKEIRTLFVNLHFSQGTVFKFRNNYGHTFEHALELFGLITELKTKYPHINFNRVPFKAITTDHLDEADGREYALYDLERCLSIMDRAKKLKVQIRLISPDNRFESRYWYYFEILDYWTLYLEKESYIELMLNSSVKRYGLPWYAIINNRIKWGLPNCNFLLSLMTKRKDLIENYGYRKWGDELLNCKLIDWEHTKHFTGILEHTMEENENE